MSFKRQKCFHLWLFHFTVFQQTNYIYGPDLSTLCFSGSNIYMYNFQLICTLKGQLCVRKSVTFHLGKRPIGTCNFSLCTRIIMINFELPSLWYCSLFITGQIIVLFCLYIYIYSVDTNWTYFIQSFFPLFFFVLGKNHAPLSSWLLVDIHTHKRKQQINMKTEKLNKAV